MEKSQNFPPPILKNKSLVICLVLALVTLAVYWPVTSHQFIIFDDDDYITDNSHVTAGLTWPGIVWAFTTDHAANWHPLTWISHMADCQIYGVKPGGHHLTNVLFHIANTLLLFLLLKQMTAAIWRSAFVAAFFAWHPLHVESVAWAAERKDVLSIFFWLLTLMAYARYARKRSRVEGRGSTAETVPAALDARRSTLDYFLALFLFACGLMSKPMVVTLPFVLLLLDFWPLQRFQLSTINYQLFFRLVIEKIPFFALSFAGSLVTYLVQKTNGAVSGVSIFSRVESVLLTYARYISKTFWPADLSIVYPYRYSWPAIFVIGTALLLVIWSALFIYRAKKNPYLVVGWFWFFGTLVPTIGIVQVGAQSMADRYMYIPSIGLFIIVVWGTNDLFNNLWPEKRKFLPLLGGAALASCLVVTSIQLSYWQNSISLFLHAIEVTTDNYVADNCLGKAFEIAGKKDEALVLYLEAVRIEPRFPQSQFNLAISLLEHGKADEGFQHLEAAALLDPRDADVQFDLGTFFSQHDKLKDAVRCFTTALKDRPDFPKAKTALDQILAAHPELKFREPLDTRK
jgi:tetratricopeptide (TPR) repeat protein